jgi:hypothetical protein
VSLPATHYARSGDVAIAYQVFGEGPRSAAKLSGVPGEWRLFAVVV